MGSPFFDVPDIRGDAFRELNNLALRSGIDPALLGGVARGSGVPNTRARLSHAYTLQTGRGQVVGAVFRTENRTSRDVEFEYENDVNANGEPADIVPQIITTQSFAITRWDLYDTIMEEVFGEFEIEMLTDQTRGFKLREVWRAPNLFLNSRGRRYEYLPMWFTDLGREVNADGDRTIRVAATLSYLRKRKVQ